MARNARTAKIMKARDQSGGSMHATKANRADNFIFEVGCELG